MLKKLRLSFAAILILALLASLIVSLWGEQIGLRTSEERSQWQSIIAVGAILGSLFSYLDCWSRWGVGLQRLTDKLKIHWTENGILAQIRSTNLSGSATAIPNALANLRQTLQGQYGRSWHYHQRWLLLTGDDEAIARLFPSSQQQPWLITDDVVLLWCKSGPAGQPDYAWLKQLRTLRRRRPIDGIVLVNTSGRLDQHLLQDDTVSHLLSHISQGLRWRAPAVVLDLHGDDRHHEGVALVGSEWDHNADADDIKNGLLTLRDRLTLVALSQLGKERGDRYLGELSQRLDIRSKFLSAWIAGVCHTSAHHVISGVFFAPYPVVSEAASAANAIPVVRQQLPYRNLPLWRHLAKTVRPESGRRIGWHPVTLLCIVALVGIALWNTGMLLSAVVNQRDIHSLQQTLAHVTHAPSSDARLRGLFTLQQEIARYEYRAHHHAPLTSRFGLNLDTRILTALWRPYEEASQRLLVAPVQQTLESELIDLAQLRSDQLDQQPERYALDGQLSLKTYLMLAEPQRSESAFLKPQLLQRWQLDTQLAPGEQIDLAERLLGFYSEHLPSHPDWRITPSVDLVTAARQTLLAAIGVEQADTTLYRKILSDAANKYPDQTLATLTLGTDPRGLIRNHAVVAGVFTRQAYEGTIASAIREAAKRHAVNGDWVLNGQALLVASQSATQVPEQLQATLSAQYFADYAEQWQTFMNNTQWASASTLPAAVEQLKLMTDARQSPVIALMKSLQYHAGAGAQRVSLSDTLVAKAQGLIAAKGLPAPQAPLPDPGGPLASAFGPVLRLMGTVANKDGSAATESSAHESSDLSLQRYLDRVSALRLRLQQINSSSDSEAQSKQLVLSMFQGKGSELADTQDYAQLVAVSLGEQWTGLGDALFVKPVTQATETLLQPAQAGLNQAWNSGIVAPWFRAFNGRYPFVTTDNDASFPELARFLRPQTGLIASFLHTQLPGVLELQGEQWVPNPASKLHFEPEFLRAINTLQRIGGRLLVQGEPQYRFELMPMPTPGITDTVLTIDAQTLHYYNQRERWQQLIWPVNQTQDAGTRIQWQTERAGTNKRYEFDGRWALIRLLERARIEPLDSATYQLTWRGTPDVSAARPATTGADPRQPQSDPDHFLPRAPMAQAPDDMSYPLSYLMRTEAGRGPLEMLSLRDFMLPSRIFVVPSRHAGQKGQTS
ncbi:type VI secretion system protein ImpL [Herbaspirillum sp. Sphag1AN]|uniref:ImcF-related family protein n=1 Tax=unclassified Herbaspirillum TaxID=2624150 RepID=UPI00160CEE0A|nr:MULTISPECIES: ImcF-related family protein [unclassified Herbaspirillum]MBB3213269.1 type VI secretion system protein ImpL [Herbaspirillum sp. Sphag1AN]MBB3246466.1 type VI secretion system protein ImpL [Herbaspirillum sp. Sphag64]